MNPIIIIIFFSERRDRTYWTKEETGSKIFPIQKPMGAHSIGYCVDKTMTHRFPNFFVWLVDWQRESRPCGLSEFCFILPWSCSWSLISGLGALQRNQEGDQELSSSIAGPHHLSGWTWHLQRRCHHKFVLHFKLFHQPMVVSYKIASFVQKQSVSRYFKTEHKKEYKRRVNHAWLIS